VQGSPSQVNGVGLRTLSRRRSWVRIPPPAPDVLFFLVVEEESVSLVHHLPVGLFGGLCFGFWVCFGLLVGCGAFTSSAEANPVGFCNRCFCVGFVVFLFLCVRKNVLIHSHVCLWSGLCFVFGAFFWGCLVV
jgi:hypothetical protein